MDGHDDVDYDIDDSDGPIWFHTPPDSDSDYDSDNSNSASETDVKNAPKRTRTFHESCIGIVSFCGRKTTSRKRHSPWFVKCIENPDANCSKFLNYFSRSFKMPHFECPKECDMLKRNIFFKHW